MNTIDTILKHKIVSIARRIYGKALQNLATSLSRGGIKLIELTFDQNDPEHLRKTKEGLQLLSQLEDVFVGAGTVLTLEQLYCAHDAGAKYIVSPNVDPKIIEETKRLGLVSIPGAATPTEILLANNAGADFIKIFPALPLGMEYLKAICQPLNHLRFVANAGVTPENIQDFFAMGFAGVGISNYLSDSKLISEGNFAEIEFRASYIRSKV